MKVSGIDIITRFAPSPSGLLHLGHAYSALFTEREARDNGGRFLLRIEDIDQTRCRPEFEVAIFEDLAWLGLTWEEPVRRQSDHMDEYQEDLNRLEGMGLIYPCFCTRKEIRAESAKADQAPHEPHTRGPVYPGTCRRLYEDDRNMRIAAGDAYALRLNVRKATHLAEQKAGLLTWNDLDEGVQNATPEIFGDVVMARKDEPTSYHLSVTVDDALQGISLVTRGDDLRDVTHVHRLLQALLDYETPEYKFHHLLTGEDGKRFAKRDKSLTLRTLRQNGKTPTEVRRMAGFE